MTRAPTHICPQCGNKSYFEGQDILVGGATCSHCGKRMVPYDGTDIREFLDRE